MNIALERFSGFSDLYHQARPQPPKAVADLVRTLSGREKLGLVVDLGSGTGLSTVLWMGVSESVLGVEPNEDMRAQARQAFPELEFKEGSSYHIPAEDHTADAVCCSQSFHWMDPQPTIKEVSRVLKPGGLFTVFDCAWPVTVQPESEVSYRKLFREVDK